MVKTVYKLRQQMELTGRLAMLIKVGQLVVKPSTTKSDKDNKNKILINVVQFF